jgi:T5SS/PEP-CTERM-associated repeat protein
MACKRASLALTVSALGICLETPTLYARPARPAPTPQYRDWDKSLGGTFNQKTNWDSAAPGPIDIARFQLAGAYTVSFTANNINSQLLIGNDKLVFDLRGFRYTLASSNQPSLAMGFHPGDVSRLSIRSGTLKTADAALALAPGSSANLTLANATWRSSGTVHVGAAGNGGLTIISGGKLLSQSGAVGITKGSNANVLLSGHNASWTLANSLIVGGKSATHAQVLIRADADLSVHQNLEIRKGGAVLLDGGALNVGAIIGPGQFDFLSGQLNLQASNLSISASAPLGAQLELTRDRSLHVSQNATVAADGLLSLDNSDFSAHQTTNLGHIQLSGDDAALHGALLLNQYRLSGQGLIDANLDNRPKALIALLPEKPLAISGTLTNSGRIKLAGGTLQLAKPALNNPAGSIYGAGQLIAPKGLNNLGILSFTGPNAKIVGPVNNGPSGSISVTSKNALFANDFHHNGAGFYIGPASTVTFQKRVDGPGNFTGDGTTLFEGAYSPGNSTANVVFAGDVLFGPAGLLQIEIGGGIVGSRYDRLNADQALLTNVDVVLINDFDPPVGADFNIVRANHIRYADNFLIRLPAFHDGRRFVATKGEQALKLTVVIPEPAPGLLLLTAAAATTLRRRSRLH